MFQARVLRNDFKRLSSGMKGNAERIEEASAKRVAEDWSNGVRVSDKSGEGYVHLRDDIRHGKINGQWTAYSTKEYAEFEEFGTRYMGGSHAAVNAAARERDRFLQALRDGLVR